MYVVTGLVIQLSIPLFLKKQIIVKILNNCYLLGIDTDLIISKKELREKQLAACATEKAIKKDPIFKQYYLGKNDAELDVAEFGI